MSIKTEVAIRFFEARDQQAARMLIVAGLGEHFGFVDETCNPDLDDIFETYVAAGHIFLVALVGEELIATGSLVFHGSDTGELVRISVAPHYRRLGIAKLLVQTLINLARQHQLDRLEIETNRTWQNAITLYHQLGFTQYKTNDTQIFMALDLTTISN